MSARYFNWKLAIVLVISLAVLGVGAFSLRQWRKAGRADRGLKLGSQAYDQHRWEDAATHFGHYLAIEPDNVPILLKYADAQLKIRPAKQSNLRQAEEAYRTVLRADKGNSEAARRLTEVYLGIRKFGEAELIARRYIEVKPDPELQRMLAVALIEQRKFNEADRELKVVLQKHPDQILAYENLGRLLEQRPNDFEDTAAALFDRAVENNPSSALAHIVRAGFYRRSNRPSDALVELKKAEGRDLSDVDVRLRLAREYVILDQLDKAEEHLAAVCEVDAKNEGLWQTWAGLALKSRSTEKMLKVAETGLAELGSQPWDFMPLAAELFVLAGRFEDANDCISQLHQKDMGRATVAFLRGLVASEQGHLLEAVKHWEESMQSGNRSPQVRLALASALSDLGDIQSARRQLGRVVSENPEYVEGRLALARLLTRTGDWAGVLEHAAAAAKLAPANSDAALLHLRARIKLMNAGYADSARPGGGELRDIQKELSALENMGGSSLEVKLMRLQLAVQRQDYAEAESLLTQLKQAGMRGRELAMTEADLLVAKGRLGDAILRLQAAMEAFPDDFELVSYAATLADQQGDREKSEKMIQDALDRIDDAIGLRKLGLLLSRSYVSWGQQDKAYLLLTALERRLPKDIPIKRRLLACEQTVKDRQTAQRLVDEIKLLEGQSGWQWRYEQARLWYSAEDFADRYARVVSILQENITANPDDQASRLLLARCYERVGASKLAIAAFREALNRSPNDLRVIIPAVAALYNAKEYGQAEQILTRASEQRLSHPLLNELQLRDHLRRGQLDQASDVLQEILNNDPENQGACLSLALLKMQQQNYAEASRMLEELKAHDPNSLPVTAAQIQLSLRQKKPDEALRLSDEIVNRVNGAFAYILRARTYATLGQYEKAHEDLGRAIADEPNNPEVWVARSDFFRSREQVDKAVADIRRALCLAPNDLEVQKRAISLFLTSKDPADISDGRAMLERSLEADAENADLLLYEVRSLLIEGTTASVAEAEQILARITRERPERSEAWVLLGELAIKQGQPDKAMNAALGGLAHRPTDKTMLLLKARAEAARSPVLAIPTLEVLNELDPADVRVALLLANTYTQTGEPKKAMALLRKQLTTSEGASRRQYEIAMSVALYKNGSKQKAEKDFQSLLQAEPNDPTPLLEYIRLLKEDRQWGRISQNVISWHELHKKDATTTVGIAGSLLALDDGQARKAAEDILRTVLRDDPECIRAMSTLAIMLQTTGRTAEAAILYERILALEPDNLIAINNLAWIMCKDQGKYREALELAQRGLKIDPDYFDLVDTRGVIYYHLGEFDKAAVDFRKCIESGPRGAPAGVMTRFYLARTLAKQGQKEQAIAQLKDALDLQGRIGGMSGDDLREAQLLLRQLQEGTHL